MYAQYRVQSSYQKWSQVGNTRSVTGAELARILLPREHMANVHVEMTSERLSDHYDPRANILRLSPEVAQQSSVAAMSVVDHEIVHVLARHGAQRIAKSELTNGLVGAVGVASGQASAAQTAAMIGQLVNMHYGRDDELESDTLGVCLMIDAGYDPEAMVEVMRTLETVSGGARQPEFFSTHPNPENRIREIETAIADAPQGCPA